MVVEIFEEAEVGDDGLGVFVTGLEFADASAEVMIDARTDDDVTRIYFSAEKRHTAFDRLNIAFLGMESESEIFKKEFDFVNIFQGAFEVFFLDEKIEVVDVTTVMLIAEIDSHVTVKGRKVDV